MSNPNKNSFSYTITAPSLSSPSTVSFSNIKGNTIIDINNYPTTPVDESKLPKGIINVNNVHIKETYPIGSEFKNITISPKVDATKPYLVLILYDKDNNIVKNDPSNYPIVKKMEVHMSDWVPPNTSTSTSYTGIIIGVVVVLILIGTGAYFYFTMNKNKTIKTTTSDSMSGGIFNAGE